jgi:hypothetical protein
LVSPTALFRRDFILGNVDVVAAVDKLGACVSLLLAASQGQDLQRDVFRAFTRPLSAFMHVCFSFSARIEGGLLAGVLFFGIAGDNPFC